ncbi:MAG: choice-of-anchor L domain-containing protein [Saprospiraceae bacterium]|nr:choice-of-anchor L domain-containing protein [Saprospiraceae bacterium]
MTINSKIIWSLFFLWLVPQDRPKVASTTKSIQLAGISTSINADARYLTEEVFIAGGCFDVSNARTRGSFGSIGTFRNGDSSVGLADGIILSTGSVLNASGPNTATNFTTNFNNTATDPDLARIIDNSLIPIRDVAVLEFDFTPTADEVQFEYVFASEEYCDFVNSDYNDIFGFFISGPGINGPFSNNAENIARVPGSADFVAINNINHLRNTNYYRDNIAAGDDQLDNCPGAYPNVDGVALQDCEYDGFTKILKARAAVIPCATYHIKLVIGDITDGQYDSAVFLAANSFEAGESITVEGESESLGVGLVAEGCSDGYFLFRRYGSDLNRSLRVNYSLSPTSTAREGMDFETIPRSVTFPPNAEEVRLPINAIADGLPEGTESIVLELSSACSCSSTLTSLNIRDADPLEIELEPLFLCADEEGMLIPQINGGLTPYSYAWSTGEDDPQLQVDPPTSRTYGLTVTDACGQTVDQLTEVTRLDAAVMALAGDAYICNGDIQGELEITYAEGGRWDLLYSINGTVQPPLVVDRSPFFIPVSIPGIYRLESVSRGSCEGSVSGTANVELIRLRARAVVTELTCPDAADARMEVLVEEGQGPFRYRINQQAFQNDPVFNGLSPGLYQLEVEDVIGCTWNDQVRIEALSAPEVSLSFAVEGCDGGHSGTVNIQVQAGAGVYQYSLDGNLFQPEPNFSGLSLEENYTLWVEDQQGCLQSIPFEIPRPAELKVQAIEQRLSCPSTVDGQIILLASGGVPPYSYQLGSDPVQNSNTFGGLSEGTYLATVRDGNGCEVELQASIAAPPDLAIEALDIREPSCPGSEDGAALLMVAGGTGSRSYLWSNGSTSASLEGVKAGDYTLTVTDSKGCTLVSPLTIPGEPWPGRLIQGSSSLCEGSRIRLKGPEGDFIYSWSTGATDEGIWVEQAGTYGLTVTNADGCAITDELSVDLSTTLSPRITGSSTFCAGDTVELAVGEFDTYSWSTGVTSSSIAITDGGWYAVSVTNGAECSGMDSVFVDMKERPTAVILGSDILCEGLSQRLVVSTEMSDYQWSNEGVEQEVLATAPGLYSVTFTDEFGCRGEDSIEVSEALNAIRQLTHSICAGDSLIWNGEVLFNPGQYQHTFVGMASNGCDSIEVLQLQVFSASTSLTRHTISEWDQISWQGEVYTTTGFYQDTLPNANVYGCDSILQLQLTVLPIQKDTLSHQLCAGDSLWVFNEWQTEEGAVQDTFQNGQGLDSLLVTTFIKVNPAYHEIISLSLCEGETWEGGMYDADTTLFFHYSTVDGCDSVLQYELAVFPTYDLVDSLTICQGDSLFFAGSWQKTTGVYVEQWMSAQACDSIITLYLAIDPCPFTWTQFTEPVKCAGESNGRIRVAIEGGVGPFVLFLMNAEGGSLRQVNDLREASYEFSNLAAGKYHLRLWDTHTQYQEETDVEIIAPPVLTLETLAEIPVSCFAGEDGEIEVQGEGGQAPYQFQWSNGATTPLVQGLSAGSYDLTLSDQNGCTEKANYVLTEPTQIEGQSRFMPSWCGDESGLLYFDRPRGGTPPYLFGSPSAYFLADTIQPYDRLPTTAIIQDANGCEEEIPVISIPLDLPEIEFPRTQIHLGDTVRMDLIIRTPYVSLTWSPAESLSCDTCLSTLAFPTKSTRYQATLTDPLGCELEEDVWIQVDTRGRIYVPSAFSPNGDANNDRFTIYGGPEVESIKQLSIFDRWGSQLFHVSEIPANDLSFGWDGIARGQPAAVGTYVYLAEIQLSNGQVKRMKGELMLMR